VGEREAIAPGGRRVRAGVSALFVTMGLAALPASATADSASVSYRDAGGGQIEATISVTSTSCSTSGYCGWFAYAVERHPTLECRDDTTFIRWVGSLHEGSGTSQETTTFRPFFPRSTRLCILLRNGAGTNPAGETTITLPAGYGAQRSSGNNCSNFSSQASTQYYLYLYPSDPSGLDGDNDGVACEANDCPCGAEYIPPEPEPAPLSTGTSPPSSLPSSGRRQKKRAILPILTARGGCHRVVVSSGSGWTPTAYDDQPFTERIALRLVGQGIHRLLRVPPSRTQPVRWGGLVDGRYRLEAWYPGDRWHRASRTRVMRPRTLFCSRRAIRFRRQLAPSPPVRLPVSRTAPSRARTAPLAEQPRKHLGWRRGDKRNTREGGATVRSDLRNGSRSTAPRRSWNCACSHLGGPILSLQ
jgi:hypothetical protein